jgi:hypothetical protein
MGAVSWPKSFGWLRRGDPSLLDSRNALDTSLGRLILCRSVTLTDGAALSSLPASLRESHVAKMINS